MYPSAMKLRKIAKELRQSLANPDTMALVDSFQRHAIDVCDEAIEGPTNDLQRVAQLQFIERVLNG